LEDLLAYFFHHFATTGVGVNLPQPSRLDLDPDPTNLCAWDGQWTLYLVDKYNLTIFFGVDNRAILMGIRKIHTHGYCI
jgi:hypothetical protein